MSTNDTALMERQRFAKGMLQMRVNQAAFASSSMSLKKLTQKSILKNTKYFCELALSLQPENPFSRISNTMKKELIELLTEMLEEDRDGLEEDINLPHATADYQQLTVLQLLLNKKLTSFHFPTDFQVSKGQASELWQCLMEVRPPDLHTVFWRNNYFEKRWNFQPILNSLLSVPAVFPNLKVLRLETLKCKDEDLINIADHLTKLRVLGVQKLNRVSRTGIEALRRLTLLQEFVFGDCSDELVLRHCLELLPHLHIIGNRLEATQIDDYEYETMMTMGKALSQIEAPCTLQLHHLWLHDTEQILDKISLPELQVLELCETIAMHPWLFGGLPKLTELYLYSMHQDTLMPVLGHVGRQLQVLLVDIPELPRLDLVLEACPNLTQLHVYTEMGPRHTSQLRPEMLKHLKTVKFDAASGYLEAGLLFQILSLAPELRSIELGSLRFDEDWEALAELAEEGTCMRHLETIKIESKTRFTTLEQRLLAKARVSCSINCPRLKIFSVESDYDSDE